MAAITHKGGFADFSCHYEASFAQKTAHSRANVDCLPPECGLGRSAAECLLNVIGGRRATGSLIRF
jgi:hypothetical protein